MARLQELFTYCAKVCTVLYITCECKYIYIVLSLDDNYDAKLLYTAFITFTIVYTSSGKCLYMRICKFINVCMCKCMGMQICRHKVTSNAINHVAMRPFHVRTSHLN